MFINQNKYRPLIYFISLFYVNFFFLSPYFHHHHEEEDATTIEVLTFHSHIINQHEEEHHDDDQDHHVQDDSNHDHFIKLNSSHFLSLVKSIDLSSKSNLYFINRYPYLSEVNDVGQLIVIYFPSKLQRDKYVYTESNLPPPLA
jgi:hypothetical protein